MIHKSTDTDLVPLNLVVVVDLRPTIIVPSIFPTVTYIESNFRSHAFVKVIERFGVLKETIATDLGSKVSTKDLAYDSETGSVLLTQTKTDFNDDVYSFTFPAHWYYKGMGMACLNTGVEIKHLNFINGGCGMNNGNSLFVSGDEVSIYDPNNLSQKVIAVVGCGGDRDREKRPVMAQIAARKSQQVILTSDNPRTEDPMQILKENIEEQSKKCKVL